MIVDRTLSAESTFDQVLQVLSCKWTPSVFRCLEEKACRPCQMARTIPDISPRVLHRCLDRLEEFGLVGRQVFAAVPPHVEYQLTERGRRFLELLQHARAHADSWAARTPVDTSSDQAASDARF